jgi:hypothetical protein
MDNPYEYSTNIMYLEKIMKRYLQLKNKYNERLNDYDYLDNNNYIRFSINNLLRDIIHVPNKKYRTTPFEPEELNELSSTTNQRQFLIDFSDRVSILKYNNRILGKVIREALFNEKQFDMENNLLIDFTKYSVIVFKDRDSIREIY